MSKSAAFVCFALAAVLLAAAGSLWSAPKDLSADMVMISGGQVKDTMKIFISGQKSRTEMSLMGGTVGIARRDTGILWTLYPSKKQYMERPLDPKYIQNDPTVDPPGMIKKEKIGAEQVNGYQCTKYRITVEAPRTGQTTVISWFADALGLAVRSEFSGITTELRNIQLGPQPANLFELPAGYQKVETPPMPNIPEGLRDMLKRKGASIPKR